MRSKNDVWHIANILFSLFDSFHSSWYELCLDIHMEQLPPQSLYNLLSSLKTFHFIVLRFSFLFSLADYRSNCIWNGYISVCTFQGIQLGLRDNVSAIVWVHILGFQAIVSEKFSFLFCDCHIKKSYYRINSCHEWADSIIESQNFRVGSSPASHSVQESISSII